MGGPAALPFTKDDAQTPEELEASLVHHVYNEIADHFSDTRYKGWPVVEQFLASLPQYSTVGDLGCGNGKYLSYRRFPDLWMVGSDQSSALIDIAARQHPERDVLLANVLTTCLRPASLDATICIAVVHHLVTYERRLAAVRQVLLPVRPGGKALFFVWAYEQPKNRRAFQGPENNKVETINQDRLVPWRDRQNGHHQRFYHLFVKGELDSLVQATGIAEVATSGYDRDNWYVIAQRT